MTHNPIEFIQLLRDHTAAPDRRLVFLFGAGTSGSINVAPAPPSGRRREFMPLIPAIAKMTEECKAAAGRISSAHAAAWTNLEEECNAIHSDSNIERILGRLRLKIAAAAPTESALGLTLDQMVALEQTLKKRIAELAAPSEADIPDQIPHDNFARWVGRARRKYPIEVFTTNYDILLERALERMRVPTFDGFVGSYEPYFSPDTIADEDAMPSRIWTRVWKLHGSINWRVAPHGGAVRTYGSIEGDMILPSHQKYDESRKMPYLALMDRLTNCLSKVGSLLITCGYSWNDEHVNAAILTALDNHPSNAVVALMHSSSPNLMSLAHGRDNLFVICPRHGVIRGESAEWAFPEQIDSAVASFLDLSFDSDAAPDEPDEPTRGSMHLGDFNVFCDFLNSMNRSGTPL